MTTSSKSRPGRGHAHALVKLSGLGRLGNVLGPESSKLYLEEFLGRLKGMLRENDRLLKLSANKYCLVLRGVRSRHLVELAAAKLQRTFEPPAEIVGSQVHFRVFAGFAVPGEGVTDSGTLVRRAEAALSEAQVQDRPYAIFDPEAEPATGHDPALIARLRQALDRGEFALYYQPKYSAAYRTIVGAEGLVRWIDADEERVRGPFEFIEAAEKDPLIETLTEHLVRMAIARCNRWDPNIGVAVNVTPRLLERPHFVQVVQDALDLHGFAAPRLTIEVTERGNLSQNAFAQLEALRELGLVISIDDFGTGQCSLSYFRNLPADQIKIDMTFVQAMRTSRRDMAIVRACIELAHSCDMQVVAEGVEDEQTADLLTEMGCDILQGYWFSKPMDGDAFEERLLAGLFRADEADQHSDLLRG